MMNDDSMATYIPAFGDRLAAVAFARKKQGQVQSSGSLERLKHKVNRKRGAKVNCNNYPSTSKQYKHDGEQQIEYKRIELGWKHYDVQMKQYKQVRSQNGGGCRQLRLNVQFCQKDVVKEGKSLFFHKGKSSKGSVNDMLFTVQDFRNIEMEDKTIGEIYKSTCIKLLRLYICTKHCDDMILDDDDEIQMGESLKDTTSLELDETVMVPTMSSTPEHQDEEAHHTAAGGIEINLDVGATEEISYSYSPLEHEQVASTSGVVEGMSAVIPIHIDNDAIDLGVMSAVIPIHIDNDAIDHVKPTVMHLNRVNILSEMIAFFKAPEIIRIPIMVVFKKEEGADAQGVSRDAYSSFWKEFFETLADGEDVRVPTLNPDYGLEEWQAVGRILVKGYLDVSFFPLQLAPVFFEALMFGEESLSPEDLFDSFMLYLSESDREVVKSALQEEVMSEEDKDAFEDLLDREGCHNIPGKAHVKLTIQQLGHKCLIQNCSYVLEAMRIVVTDSLSTSFPSMDSVRNMYSKLQPTVKKVCKLLHAEAQNKQEAQALRYLGQYIRSQDNKSLAALLKFLTGSSVMSVPKISVVFTNSSGFGRTPIIHTCGPVLELPATYASYREFRSEWDPLLASGYLTMTIA